MTAATTRIVRSDADDSISLSPPASSHRHAEKLLPHEEHVAVDDLRLGQEPEEGAVGAAEIGQVHLPVLRRDAAVEAGDVAVLGEDHVAALAAEVHARLRDGEGVADDVAADDQRDAADVALGGAA